MGNLSRLWLLTCNSSFGIEELENLLRENAMADLASLLWQRGQWGPTLGRCVQGARSLDQTAGDNITTSRCCCKKCLLLNKTVKF